MNGKENSSNGSTRFLTYLVYVLLGILTLTSGYQMMSLRAQDVKISKQNERLVKLPDKFVRLERYTCDVQRIEKCLARLM